ncbi:PE/PPE C-terminal domain-containing protein, partial [Mycobacterium tuberculosis]
ALLRVAEANPGIPGMTVPAAPHGAAGTVIPGMPGLASATRSSAGFGAPRYGAKPIVMPKPAV